MSHKKKVYSTRIDSREDPNVEYFFEIFLTPGTLAPYAEDIDGSFSYKVWGQTTNDVRFPHQNGFGYQDLFMAVVNAKKHIEVWEIQLANSL